MYLTVLKRAGYEIANLSMMKTTVAVALCAKAATCLVRGKKDEGLKLLMQAHRVTTHSLVRFAVEKQIAPVLKNNGEGTYLFSHYEQLAGGVIENPKHEVEKRVIVLKNVRIEDGSVVEKGVVYVMFTPTLRALLKLYDYREILRRYYLVLEPSWAGYCDAEILCLCNQTDDPVYVCATEKTDFDFLNRLSTNLVPLSFGASNWPDPDVFKPLGLSKKYDAVMVAVWGSYKRHHLLFKAIDCLKPMPFLLALVGVPYKSSRRSIEELLHYYGIADQVDLFENLNQAQVNEILNQSKVNVLLSKKEGSNRSIFEGFFADVPGIVLEDNIGVNKSYINTFTGMLIKEHELADTLRQFSLGALHFTPRAWAMENISPTLTTASLNETIKAHAIRSGKPWTEDIAEHVNRPELQYLKPADAVRYRSSLTLLD